MNKTVIFGLLVIILVFDFMGCSNNTSGFVEVTDITNLPTEMALGSTLTLSGTVFPNNATSKSITWSIRNANNTGASISNNILSVENFGNSWGWLELTATINNGFNNGNPFSKHFAIQLLRFNSNTQTVYFTFQGGDDWQEWLTDGHFVNNFYNGVFEHGKKYKISINGNLNIELPYLKVEVECHSDDEYVHYGSAFSGESLSMGLINLIFIIEIDDPNGRLSINRDFVAIGMKTNWTNDVTMTEDDHGKIMALVNNFNMTIEEYFD